MRSPAARGRGGPSGTGAGVGALAAFTACALVLVWRMTASGPAPLADASPPGPPSRSDTAAVPAAAAPGASGSPGIAPRAEQRAEPIPGPTPASAPSAPAAETLAAASPANISEATDAMQRRAWRLLERCGTALEGAPVSWEVKLRFDGQGREVGREARLADAAEGGVETLTRGPAGGEQRAALARCLAAADDEPVTISPPGAATEVALTLKLP